MQPRGGAGSKGVAMLLVMQHAAHIASQHPLAPPVLPAPQAPEQLIGLKCTVKADVYSYGLGEPRLRPLLVSQLAPSAPCLPSRRLAHTARLAQHSKRRVPPRQTLLSRASRLMPSCPPCRAVLWEICTREMPVRGQIRDIR